MNEESQRINEVEQRLLGIINAQAEVIQSFMDLAQHRLDKHKERLDTHRQDLDELQVKVEDLDINKLDCPNRHEERARIALEESHKLEADLLAEEKERNARMELSDILDRIEELEAGVPDADGGQGIIEQLAKIQEKVSALEKAIRGRFK